jgi:hypothetical protein
VRPIFLDLYQLNYQQHTDRIHSGKGLNDIRHIVGD